MVSLTVYSTINHVTSLLVAVAIMRPARWRWQISAPIIRPASVFKIAQHIAQHNTTQHIAQQFVI